MGKGKEVYAKGCCLSDVRRFYKHKTKDNIFCYLVNNKSVLKHKKPAAYRIQVHLVPRIQEHLVLIHNEAGGMEGKMH